MSGLLRPFLVSKIGAGSSVHKKELENRNQCFHYFIFLPSCDLELLVVWIRVRLTYV